MHIDELAKGVGITKEQIDALVTALVEDSQSYRQDRKAGGARRETLHGAFKTRVRIQFSLGRRCNDAGTDADPPTDIPKLLKLTGDRTLDPNLVPVEAKSYEHALELMASHVATLHPKQG